MSEYEAVGVIKKLAGPNRVLKKVEEVGIVEWRGLEEEGVM